jgi:hypothetical protein
MEQAIVCWVGFLGGFFLGALLGSAMLALFLGIKAGDQSEP